MSKISLVSLYVDIELINLIFCTMRKRNIYIIVCKQVWNSKFIISIESLGDCSFLNTCFHMDTCKVSWPSLKINLNILK